METTQLLLTIVLTISTVFAIVIGIQLIFVLKEMRTTLKNVNKIVSGFETMGVGLEHGLGEVMGFVNGAKVILKALRLIGKN